MLSGAKRRLRDRLAGGRPYASEVAFPDPPDGRLSEARIASDSAVPPGSEPRVSVLDRSAPDLGIGCPAAGIDATCAVVGAIVRAGSIASEQATTESPTPGHKALDLALRIARVGSWELNVETGEETWTEALHDLLGDGGRRLAPGRPAMARLVHPGDLGRLAAALERTISTGVDGGTIYRVRRIDGEERFFSSHWATGKDASGKVRRLSGYEQDVTESLRAADELREKRTAIDTATNGIAICDRTGAILFANAAFDDIFGLDPGTGVGVTLERFCTDPEEAARVRREMTANGRVRTEVTIRRSDGRLAWVDVLGAPIAGRDRAVGGWAFSFADISEPGAPPRPL